MLCFFPAANVRKELFFFKPIEFTSLSMVHEIVRSLKVSGTVTRVNVFVPGLAVVPAGMERPPPVREVKSTVMDLLFPAVGKVPTFPLLVFTVYVPFIALLALDRVNDDKVTADAVGFFRVKVNDVNLGLNVKVTLVVRDVVVFANM